MLLLQILKLLKILSYIKISKFRCLHNLFYIINANKKITKNI